MSERPLDPVVSALIEQGVAPVLARIAKDLGRDLTTRVLVMRDGVTGPAIVIDTAAEGRNAPIDGEVRMNLRETHGGNRFVYRAEAVYNKDISTSGFSGFVAKGEARVEGDEDIEVRPKNWTGRYNVWEFSDD